MWPFVTADLVLVGVATTMLLLSPRPISHFTIFVVALVIVLAAVICLMPFVISRRRQQRLVEVEKPHPKLRIMLH